MAIRSDAQEFVDFLNELFKLDPVWMEKLIEVRMPCNKHIVAHPTVQVMKAIQPHARFKAGLLGLINGYFGAFDDGPNKDHGAIYADYDDITGELHGFKLLGENETL
jgi:hypothetical protein